MINVRRTRQLYESYTGANRSRQGGAFAFVNLLRHQLGLCDTAGNDYKDRAGNRVLREQQIRAEEFSFQELAQAMIGPGWQQYFDPAGLAPNIHRARMLVESAFPEDRRALLEATGVGVDVSAFANVNAWTSVVGGLIEVKILEAFQNPLYIADELMPAEPTKLNGQKVIGATRLGDQAEFRLPGETHKRSQIGERWVQTPQTNERALAVDVTKEVVFFDLTGQVLQHAGMVGDWIAYNKELYVIDAFIGVTSGSTGAVAFNYKGTAYAAFQSSRTIGILNDQANDLVDWTSVESSWLLFVRMQDPDINTRVLVNPNTVLVNPARFNTAKLIFGGSEHERRTAIGATQSTATTLQIQRTQGRAPVLDTGTTILMSPLVEQRCTDASGLALSQSNANQYWWHFEKGKPCRYMQNWPLTIAQAPSTNYEMLDRGLTATYFANERGTPSFWSPWHIVRNHN